LCFLLCRLCALCASAAKTFQLLADARNQRGQGAVVMQEQDQQLEGRGVAQAEGAQRAAEQDAVAGDVGAADQVE
jgi:hypothetical protein